MRRAGHVAHIGEMKNAYKILIRKPKHRWDDNITMYLREIGLEGVN
jgi:hypothetical protein